MFSLWVSLIPGMCLGIELPYVGDTDEIKFAIVIDFFILRFTFLFK